MSLWQSGVLSRERPTLIINYFVFALAVPACTLWGALYQTPSGTVFSGTELLWTQPSGQKLCPKMVIKSDTLHIFWPFIHQPVIPQETCFCPSGLCSSISGTSLGTPPGGTTPGAKSAHVSHKKSLHLRQKWATSLPVSSVFLPLVMVVLWQVLGGGGSA